MFSLMQENFSDLLPHVRNVYVVVPEKGKPETHDEYNGFFYPKIELTGLLPWREAKEGTLIYTTHQLEVIEKYVVFDDPPVPIPKFSLVVADYPGREKRA